VVRPREKNLCSVVGGWIGLWCVLCDVSVRILGESHVFWAGLSGVMVLGVCVACDGGV